MSDQRGDLDNIKHSISQQTPDVVSMLVQRRIWWASIETTLGECFVSAGIHK